MNLNKRTLDLVDKDTPAFLMLKTGFVLLIFCYSGR